MSADRQADLERFTFCVVRKRDSQKKRGSYFALPFRAAIGSTPALPAL